MQTIQITKCTWVGVDAIHSEKEHKI
jgi:hypothetical protein